jgi:ADP-ribose pyrophosphatase YjhB (NUDIX family)
VYRDSSGRTLTDYPRPSVAVDTAVLTVGTDGALAVLLVRRAGGHRRAEWALPGTFLHPGETLADAVRRSLAAKAGLVPATAPRQLHVFDDPRRDDRGWVLSVAHVAALPWREIEPVLEAGLGSVCVRPVDDVHGLPFDHDEIVRRAAADVRLRYRERPDPDELIDEPFTIRALYRLHDAVVGGLGYSADTFRRTMIGMLDETRRMSEGTVGKPAQLYVRR